MRKISFLAISMLVLAALSGCTLNSAAPQLIKAIDNTSKQASTLGVVLTDTLPDGSAISEVHKPNSTFFVDSAVFNNDNSLKQISRKTPGDVLSLQSSFGFAKASINSTVDFAATTFKVLSSSVTVDKKTYTLALKLKDTTGSMGTINTNIVFLVQDDLVQTITLQNNLFNPSNPEEVCLYYPTGCSTQIAIIYNQDTIDSLMKQALTLYETSQLHSQLAVTNFEEIMTQMNETYSQDSSWTTTNSDQSAGVVFDESSNKGVSWDQYGGQPVKFDAKKAQENTNGPDRGFTSSIFFDTTDGGSTFFYDKVLATVSGTTTTYDITNTDGSIVGSFTFVNGLLDSFIDNSIGVKEQYQVSPKADLALLAKKGN